MSKHSELKNHLFQRIPGLKDANIEDHTIESARIIRRWVARSVNQNPNTYKYASPYKIKLEEELNLLDDLILGYICGGYASFLQKIYKLLGFSSVRVGFGVPDAAMHSVTLVVIKQNNELIVSAQDSYVNGEYSIGEESSVSDINDIISAVINNSSPVKLIDHYPEERRIFLENLDGNIIITSGPMFDPVSWYDQIKKDNTSALEKYCSRLGRSLDESQAFDLLASPRRIFLLDEAKCKHDEFMMSSLETMLQNTLDVVIGKEEKLGVDIKSFPLLI